jgi:hypothetical protein
VPRAGSKRLKAYQNHRRGIVKTPNRKKAAKRVSPLQKRLNEALARIAELEKADSERSMTTISAAFTNERLRKELAALRSDEQEFARKYAVLATRLDEARRAAEQVIVACKH